jgi:16S rRNA G966 N2-methylase RsmD
MPYRYAVERPDYSDLSSGRVLRSLPGFPAFPVRLASEIFMRCAAHLPASQPRAPLVLYDPCCGSGYLLAVTAWLHREMIGAVIGSDIDARAVDTARGNLALLSLEGLDARAGELAQMAAQYGKESHQAAQESAQRMREQLAALSVKHPIQTRVFQADAAQAQALQTGMDEIKADIVLTDIPYRRHSQWSGAAAGEVDPARALLAAIRGILSDQALVAVASDKQQKITHDAYRRVEHFKIGKRQVVILQPIVT